MSPSKQRAEILALRDAALEDLMATPGDELLREAAADGEDAESLSHEFKIGMRNAAAEALREQAAGSKRLLQAKAARRPGILRPSIEAIKRIVEQAFQRDKNLGLAFRSGKSQSDDDWGTLYDDLVALGAIEPDRDVD